MSDLPITLVDMSSGSAQDKNAELGKLRAQPFQVVESIDPGTQRQRVHDGYFQPRNFHVSEGDPLDKTLPNILDRRFSIQLIADHQNGFGTFKDLEDPLKKYSSLKSDWPFSQRSTRVIDGTDPKGKGALLASAWKVVDDHKRSYSLAIPINRETGSEKNPDTDTIASGYVYDATNKAAGYLDSVLVVNPKDTNAQGKDGTSCGLAGIPTDAHFEYVPAQSLSTTSGPKGRRPPIDQDKHGPIKFDGTTDITSLTKGFMGLDKSVTPNQWVPVVSGGGGATASVQSFDVEFTIPASPTYHNDSFGFGLDWIDMGVIPVTGQIRVIGSCQVIEETLTGAFFGTPAAWLVGIGGEWDGSSGFASRYTTGGGHSRLSILTCDFNDIANPSSPGITNIFPNGTEAGAKTNYLCGIGVGGAPAGATDLVFSNSQWSSGQADSGSAVKGIHLYVTGVIAGVGALGVQDLNGGKIKVRVFYLTAPQQF